MAYIGSPQGTGFSTIRSQQFTGNGSLTAFTMRNSVSRPEHIEVFVNNVRQDPHSAYTVSGTTLTFTEAPGDATNNIYVIYLGGSVNTTEIPPDATIGLRDGLKAAPSLFRSLELATGMYFPKANTVAFAQGGKDIFTGNNSIVTLKISGTTVATINSTGMNIAGSVFDDGTALLSSVSANTQLGSGVITQHAIASGNVTSTELRSSGLLTANTQFNAGIITAHAIATGAIGPTELATGAVSANTKIGANIIDASNIKAGAVGASELATGAVSANTKMAADVVGARELRIGNIAAANGVFTHNINTFTKPQRSTVNSVTVGAANVTLNFGNTNVFDLTLGATTHLNRPSNIAVGQAGTIFVTQDGTGSRTLSYSSVFDFAGGTAPTLTTTASAVDRIDYVVKSTSSIHAVATLALS